jgi:hypothetical protein
MRRSILLSQFAFALAAAPCFADVEFVVGDVQAQVAQQAIAVGEDVADDDAPAEPAAPAPAGGEKKLDELGKIPAPKLDVRPNSLQINSYVSFNEQGQQASSQTNCNLTLMITCDGNLHPVGYKNLKITRIVTDAGGELTPQDLNGQNASQISVQPGQRASFPINLNLPSPPATAKAFATITGKMTLQCAVGAVKQANLPALKEIVGKRIRIEGLAADLWLTFTRNDENMGGPRAANKMARLGLEMPLASFALLANARFTDVAGNEIAAQNSGASNNGTTMTQYYYLKTTDTMKTTLSFYHRLEELETPFTVRDIALPQPPPAKGGDMVIKALPPEQAAAEALKIAGGANDKAPTKPDPNALRAVIETK